MSAARYDVIVAGAGLVGLALAAALARGGLTVALLDRQRPSPSADPDTVGRACLRDQPGQRCVPAAHRRVAGAAVRAHRGDRVDAHRRRCRGDARFLGIRAWRARARVDRRGARAARSALRPAIHVPGIDVHHGCHVRDARLFRDRGHADARRRSCVRRAPRRGRRRPPLVGASTRPASSPSRSRTGRQGVVANFECERRASRPCAAVVPRRRRACSRGCRCRVAASRSCGRRPMPRRVTCSRCRPKRSPRGWRRPASACSASSR